MIYIHQNTCISPQATFGNGSPEILVLSKNNSLEALEPDYREIPKNVLRRMGKAVRMGVGAAIPLVNSHHLSGIIMGTANGGMEDCIKFLNQIIEYDEGNLTPTNFVQSTTNAIAGQIGLLSKNTGYNATHVHRGLAFENAIIDVDMLLHEDTRKKYLLGGVDEISSYNYNIDYLGGWYKSGETDNLHLYENTKGSMAGEGSAMFVVSGVAKDAQAVLHLPQTLHGNDPKEVEDQLSKFLKGHFPAGEKPDLLLSGENGDSRLLKYYETCEKVLGKSVPVARFKHLSGEFPTATALGLWWANYIMQHQKVPGIMEKTPCGSLDGINSILIYNNYKGDQHSFMLLKSVHSQKI